MSDGSLNQSSADHLLKMEKHRIDEDENQFPDDTGGKLTLPLRSADQREDFHLDIRRGGIDLKKGRYQNRVRSIFVLARIDFGGGPHRNPDGEEIGCPHIHVYREGYGDKWAYPLLPENFPNSDDKWQLLQDFLKFCNVVTPPKFKRGLFG